MIKLAQILALAFSIVSFQTFASENVETVSARAAVEDYFSFQDLLKGQAFDPNCRPSSSCLKEACSTLSRFECDEASEVEEISRACRGVWGGECISMAKKYLSRFELDHREEMIEFLASCRGLIDFDCVDYTCQRVGRFGCDNLEEIIKINQMCAGR